jgi:ligand-binding sensor domain-containing protein/signal transduction histidine kinase
MGRWTGLSLVFLLSAGAASPALAERLPVRRFTVADGLPSDRINAFLADSVGYLWIGTGDGLSRYDGYRFVNYDDRDGLPDPIVHHVLETRDGVYFVGTSTSLCRLSPGSVNGAAGASGRRFNCVGLGGPGAPVGLNVLHEGGDGRLWIGTDRGVYLLEASAARADSFTEPPALLFTPIPRTQVFSLEEDGQGGLWIGTSARLVHRLPSGRVETFRPTSEPDPGPDPGPIFDLLVDSSGRLWAATRRFLFRLDLPLPAAATEHPDSVLLDLARDPHRTGVRSYAKPESLSTFDSFLLQDSMGSIRLLSGDLCRVDGEDLTCTPRSRILTVRGRLRQIAEDPSGALWLGTESSGIVRLTPSGLSSFGAEDGLTSERIRSIFDTPGGDLHVLAESDLSRWTGERFIATRPRVPREIRDMGWGWNQIYLEDHAGEWWIATAQGLLRYPRLSRTEDLATAAPSHVYTRRDGLNSDEIFRLYEDRRGDIWIGVLGDDERRLNRWERSTGRIQSFPLTGRFAGGVPTAFAEDRAGNLWIGFNGGGLARRHDGVFDLFPPGGSLPEGRVSQLLLDHLGRLWAATTGGGAVVVENPADPEPDFSTYTTNTGLSSNRVFCVAEDERGRIYLGTTRGVDRLDPVSGSLRHFTVADGLPSAEVQQAHRDRDGDLWFGGLTGLARLRPRPDTPGNDPPVLIDLLRVDGDARPVDDLGEREVRGVTIAPGSRRFEIGFVGLSIPAAELLRYQHRLLGASDEWESPTTDRSVHFSNLPPGTYRFEVRAVTPDGVTSSRPASVAFTVLPPFWRTWWFDISVLLALAAAAVTFHRRRTARLVELERIRTRIATDLHDEVGAGPSEIALMGELWARRGASKATPDEAPQRIAATSRRLVDAMSDIVWAINPEKDRVFSLSQRMRRFATPFLRSAGVALSFQSIEESQDRSLDGDARREILLAFQEIVNNAVKHAGCSKVSARLEVRDHHLVMEVDDDGRGFDPVESDEGTGLSSLRRRADRLGGVCEIRGTPDSGTRVTFRVPLDGKRRGRRGPAILPDRGGTPGPS